MAVCFESSEYINYPTSIQIPGEYICVELAVIIIYPNCQFSLFCHFTYFPPLDKYICITSDCSVCICAPHAHHNCTINAL